MPVVMRATIMLLILVGLPAAWVYYGPLPPNAQKVADRVIELAQEALGWQTQPQTTEVITAPRYSNNADSAESVTNDMFVDSPVVPASEIAAEKPNPLGNTSLSEQVEPLLVKLRGLGAAQYSLEKWGDAGRMYRFCCAMPLAQSKEVTRQFEAISEDPRTSIQQVLAEVSHWHTARQDQGLLRR